MSHPQEICGTGPLQPPLFGATVKTTMCLIYATTNGEESGLDLDLEALPDCGEVH
jgi:hypothetical protein